MTSLIPLRATLPLLLAAYLVPQAHAASLDLNDQTQRISYVMGANIGKNLANQGIKVDVAAVSAGISDAMGGKLALSDAEMSATLDQVRNELTAKQQAKQQADGAANSKSGADYLAANAKKAGVKTTASGLQYKVIKSGSGKTPGAADTVTVHYKGTLIDGTVFDSSIDRGEPATFPVNGVIPGWTEVLQLMKVGDEWQVVIPAELAYAERGAGGVIGPNSVLVFDIQLLGVEE